MKNIKTKKGEINIIQFLIGAIFLFLGIILLLLSFIPTLGMLFILLGVGIMWTSWYNIYYCVNCGNNHGEYPYNSCEKCGGKEFNHKNKIK